MDNLIQHHLKKFGVVTVMDVLLSDTETGQPILFLDTLKITSIGQEAQQKEIRGGIDAPELINYDYARTVSVEIQDALASASSLQVMWGGEMLDGDVEYTAIFDARPITDGSNTVINIPTEVTINADAAAADILIIDAVGGKKVKVASIDGTKLTLGAGASTANNVKVFLPATVAQSVDSGIAALAVKTTSMPPTVRLTGSTYFIDQATGKKVGAEISIPLLKINVGGGFAMEAEGDAAVFDFNGRALAHPITKQFFVIKQLGVK